MWGIIKFQFHAFLPRNVGAIQPITQSIGTVIASEISAVGVNRVFSSYSLLVMLIVEIGTHSRRRPWQRISGMSIHCRYPPNGHAPKPNNSMETEQKGRSLKN